MTEVSIFEMYTANNLIRSDDWYNWTNNERFMQIRRRWKFYPTWPLDDLKMVIADTIILVGDLNMNHSRSGYVTINIINVS